MTGKMSSSLIPILFAISVSIFRDRLWPRTTIDTEAFVTPSLFAILFAFTLLSTIFDLSSKYGSDMGVISLFLDCVKLSFQLFLLTFFIYEKLICQELNSLFVKIIN